VSASKRFPSTIHKRRPYNRPTVTKLTHEEAQAALVSKVAPGDERAEKPREGVKSDLEKKLNTPSNACTRSPDSARGDVFWAPTELEHEVPSSDEREVAAHG
jgi:spore germination cell wall hydrolase CwlJ-like protein